MTPQPLAQSSAPASAPSSDGPGPATLEIIRAAVAGLLGDDAGPVGDDDNLVGHGIDSIRIMQLANGWRRAGLPVTFAELAEKPTISAWWSLICAGIPEEPPPGTRTPAAEPEAANSGPGDPAPSGTCTDSGTEPFGLAPMQQAYWIGQADDQVLGGVSAHYYAELDGHGVEPGRLEAAVRGLLAAHGMLRARFRPDGRQQILPVSPWPGLVVHDLREDTEPGSRLNALRSRLAGSRLAADRGEVFDAQLSLLPGGATRIHLNVDMLVCDAHSFRMLLDELADRYARPGLRRPGASYSFPRYLAELAAHRDEDHERGRAYWEQRIPGLPGPPQLPLAVDPWQVTERIPGRRCRRLDAAARTALAQASARHELTLAAVIATCFAEVLAAWSAEPRFLLNLPLFDREPLHPGVTEVVGDFTNLVVLEVDAAQDDPFAAQAARLQAQLQADIGHAAYSGLEVLRDISRARPGAPLAAPVVFTSAVGMGELFGEQVRRTLGTPGWISSQTPQVWLDQQVTEDDEGLLLNWDVVEELFPSGVIDQMFAAYTGLLSRLAADQAAWDQPVPALLPAADLAIRETVNDTGGPQPGQPLHAGFFLQAAGHGDRVAVTGDGGELTYAELAGQALRIAGGLRAGGTGPGDVVAVSMPRGPDQLAAVLGVLAAGAAYLPVGADSPPGRRRMICEAAGAACVLTAERAADVARAEPLPAPVTVPLDALAYVIYTSGSTGVPKGVEITHAAAANTVTDISERFQAGPADRVLAVSALDFDLSVYDIFGVLGAGGAVVTVADEDRLEARRWAELTARHQVTLWNSVPALLDMLLTAAAPGELASLRLALLSGDWVPVSLPSRLAAQAPGARFVALGGATEAAIWSNAYEVTELADGWRSVPYGFPLRNQRFRVVDARGRDCPVWVAGELWIGGAGVARGYRGDPERTADQFTEAGGERWYRTGDLGRYWPDGTLEFLGRRDHQVKVRGHRIELGEVEAALLGQPGVTEAVAVTVAGGRQLAAAVTGPPGPPPDTSQLRSAVAGLLPAYMVPSTLTVLDELPLTGNGKVDRAALRRALDGAGPAGAAAAEPQGDTEHSLAGLWSGLLGVPTVSRTDSFFNLGGDSLVATRMVAGIQEQLGVGVTLREFFAGPTVAELAALVAARQAGTAPVEEGVI